jgi:hypothetical protein
MPGRNPTRFSFQRRSVPDYSRRSTKLRLFALVAAFMLVLAVAERARDPKSWQWLWQLDKTQQPEPLNNRLPDRAERPLPPGTFVMAAERQSTTPEIDPVDRSWREGWKDIYDRLEPAQRELLFELLHAAANRQALPPGKSAAAAELLAQMTRLWEDYQGAAFQAVAQLKGDDQTLWVDVLRQVNGRFSADLTPAIQAVIDGRTPTESEEQVLARLSETLVAVTTARVEDDTVFRPAERDIWFHILASVRDEPAEGLRQRSLGRVAYLQLFKQPDEYRGKVVSVKGTARWAYRRPAPENYLGIKEYFVYWINPSGGPNSPIVVYALSAPPGFPPIQDDAAGGMTDLREEVEVHGIFFKRWAYPARDGTYTAPLIVANVPAWQPSGLDLAAQRVGLTPAELGAAAIAALLMTVCVTAVLWYRTRRPRRADEFAPPNIAALENVKLGPTTEEALRQLEREAKGSAL